MLRRLIVFGILVTVLAAVLNYSMPLNSIKQVLAAPTAWTRSNFAVGGGHIIESSPVFADIDKDNQDEIIVGTTAQKCNGGCSFSAPTLLVVLNPDGSILWSKDPGAPIRSSPAVGDIDHDGDLEIVVGIGGDVADTKHNGAVVAYDHLGNELWRYTTVDHAPKDGYADGVFSSIALCDVDGDGNLESAFGSWDQRIYLLDYQGNARWSNLNWSSDGYYNADTVWSSAACADLNDDGQLEIIIGADITGGGILPDGTAAQDGGFLYIFDKDGKVLVRRYLPESIYSSPAVGDLDHDGDYEIVVGTAYYWWEVHGKTEQPYVYAFDTSQVFSNLPYADAAKLPDLSGWPQATDYPGFSSPALADLDKDGDLEIVIGTSHPTLNNDAIGGAGSVYAWHHTGQLVSGWPVHPKNKSNEDTAIRSSPVIGDIDNDGDLEILFAMIWDIQVYNANGTFQELLETRYTVASSPAIGDADRDGFAEVWIGASDVFDESQGYLWRFENSASGLGDLPWPVFHHDSLHTGRYPNPPELSANPSSLLVFHQFGETGDASAILNIRNLGDGSIDWTVTAKPAEVTISPMNGSVDLVDSAVVSVDPTAYMTGTHTLGNLVINGTSDGAPVDGSPVTIPVKLYVGQVSTVYMPVVVK